MTQTSSYGASRREGHNASAFYARNIYGTHSNETAGPLDNKHSNHQGGGASKALSSDALTRENLLHYEERPLTRSVPPAPLETWADTIYQHSATDMVQVPDSSVGLAFTSPPYNVGKEYDQDDDLQSYLAFIQQVGAEVYRVLKPGGRYVINIANLGRKPYIPLHAYYYAIHGELGFLPMGEVIWQKGKGANGSCAWGSWMSARAPRLRDLHEYLLVFTKEDFRRPDKGTSDIERDDFLEATLSIWEIAPESARRIGHPAPFPVALADRVIRLYSYTGDVVLDPFSGSGTTCVAAHQADRHYIGYDIVEEYCQLAQQRIAQASLP
ncbi:MAG: site-specific DNA-methyltransferase [Chloroflexota bacterium]